MSQNVKTAYGPNNATITCTLASLASGSARESLLVDNSSDLYLDALVELKVKSGAGAISSDQCVYVFVAGTVDGGTTWPDTVTGADAAITLNSPTQLNLLGVIFTPASATTYKGGPWSIARCFGGVLPQKWSIIVKNQAGSSLDTTEGNFAKLWQGIYSTVG